MGSRTQDMVAVLASRSFSSKINFYPDIPPSINNDPSLTVLKAIPRGSNLNSYLIT